MASWKKIIVSGSQAELAGITGSLLTDDRILQAKNDGAVHSVDGITVNSTGHLDGAFSGSFSGSFEGAVLGTIDSASVAVLAQTASVADRATTLSADATASFADLASDARTADSASVAARATTLSADATASFADLASDARTADSASVAARATLLSADATASFADRATSASIADELSQLATASIADTAVTASHVVTASHADTAASSSYALTASVALNIPATASHADRATSASIADLASTLSGTATASFADLASTVHDGNITTAKIADGDVTNVKLANDSVTIGTTEIDLGTTATTIAGLDQISATTGSFVLQVFESSSTIITSGSNIFGDKESDIQQFTGSILQTGSMQVTGSIHSERFSGSFSGSFEGDGNSLTNVEGVQSIDVTVVDDGGNKYALDGITTPRVTFDRAGKYRFDLSDSSNSGHPFAFRLPDDTSYTQNVTTVGTAGNAGAYVEIDIDYAASSSLKYYCTVHGNGMGNLAQVNDLDDLIASGSFSGSFQGDGSGLTGLAGTLTVDGDTGTEDVDLIDDDLQIIGTSEEIETAVTKVGNDVRVTLGLPDNITVTASLATTASIADELSQLATASIADSATSASIADTATSASATIAGNLFPTVQGLEGQTIALNSSGDYIYADLDGTGSTKKLNQTVAAQTWSFAHNLAELYPIIQVYDGDDNQLIPERVEAVDANNARLYFAEDTTGVAAAMVGGMGITASLAINADTASVATRANGLAPTVTASQADSATSASIADELSQLATASQADSATTASHALGGAGSFSGSFQGDGSNLTGVAGDFNFDGDTGATTINLLTETASFNGTAQEIVTTVTDNTLTISLPDDITVGDTLTVTGNTTVGGDLIVNGALVSASSLEVADQFIILASGSNGAIDGGIIVNQIDDDPDGKGKAFAYDSSANRWALESNLNDTASVITPDAFMGVIQEGTATPVGGADPVYGGVNGNGTIFVDTNNNEAYIYI